MDLIIFIALTGETPTTPAKTKYTENDSKVGNLARRLRKFFVWSERPLCKHKARVKTKNRLHSQRSQKPTESFSV